MLAPLLTLQLQFMLRSTEERIFPFYSPDLEGVGGKKSTLPAALPLELPAPGVGREADMQHPHATPTAPRRDAQVSVCSSWPVPAFQETL